MHVSAETENPKNGYNPPFTLCIITSPWLFCQSLRDRCCCPTEIIEYWWQVFQIKTAKNIWQSQEHRTLPFVGAYTSKLQTATFRWLPVTRDKPMYFRATFARSVYILWYPEFGSAISSWSPRPSYACRPGRTTADLPR